MFRSRVIFFLAFVWTFMLFSCRKDVGRLPNTASVYQAPIVYPGNYFPAWPGSYWVYNTGDSIVVDTGYYEHIFNTTYWNLGPPVYDTLSLPRFRPNALFNNYSDHVYVNKYGLSKGNMYTYREPEFIGLLSDNLNGSFGITAGFSGHQISGLTVTTDTTVTVNSVTYDSVIVCIHYDSYWVYGFGATPRQCWSVREYFAKNVGLILRERSNYPMSPNVITTDFSLVNYFINN